VIFLLTVYYIRGTMSLTAKLTTCALIKSNPSRGGNEKSRISSCKRQPDYPSKVIRIPYFFQQERIRNHEKKCDIQYENAEQSTRRS